MIIRKETPADIDAITDVTVAAFTDHPISNQTEHFIVWALRESGALALSLVAEMDGRVVGHIAYSPVEISDGTTQRMHAPWYGMGPVSVLPELQRQGIGTALINESLSMLKEMGGRGVALVGDPNYYQRFGFGNIPDLAHEGVPPEFFMVLPFTEQIPKGTVAFHEAFLATG